MEDFEKLGIFYLGKTVGGKKKVSDNLLLFESKNFTTHAVCVGMTGSGKTGLGISLIEEAGLDKIPSIVIDPKGDLTDLLLTFPHLSPEEFAPWVDAAEAERKGVSKKEYASLVAKKWKEGLQEWGIGAERIQHLRNSVDMDIYTPASKAGIPLSILSSFEAPPKELRLDANALRERVISTTSSLLGLVGIKADPIKSREHILIATIINHCWQQGEDLDIASLIQQVQRPPFDKIGALDLNTFYPQKERTALSINLNNLLAAPGFHAWMEGEPLDIKRLLYTKTGKPKISVISIAHLSDPERMFFVTLFLNQFLSWMRREPGTSSLKALLYMDEIFGYFPPVAMPPSKLPMLTLLKQARAFGVGIVLATQNPGDLDYKGLANCGTWFIGKLQTARDRSRVMEGLRVASNDQIDIKGLEKLLSSTGNRTFILNSVYENQPLLFQTRWTMSYLYGPLTLAQIEKLTSHMDKEEEEVKIEKRKKSPSSASKPSGPPGIPEFFIHRTGKGGRYTPLVGGIAKLHFVDTANKIDVWKKVCFLAPPSAKGQVDWERGVAQNDWDQKLDTAPVPGSSFESLPSELMQEKTYKTLEKNFESSLYQNQTLTIYKAVDLKLTSKEDESEGDFRARVALALREKKDEIIQKLKDKYAEKIASLTEKVRRAQMKMAEKKQKAAMQKADTLLSAGTTVLETLFGKRITKRTISKAGTSIQKVGRIGKESREADQAEANYKRYQLQLDELQGELKKEVDRMTENIDPEHLKIEAIEVRPRKSDIDVEQVALVWKAAS